MSNKKLLFVVNDDWFFISHRLPIAIKAKELGYDVHVATGAYEGESKLEKYGFTHHVFTIARAKINPLQDLLTVWSLFSLYKSIKPDVVHHITIKPVLFGGIAARLAGIKSVVSAISGLGVIFIDQGFIPSLKRKIVGVLYRLGLSHKNSMVITQNIDDKKIIARLTGLPNSQLSLIKGSGVDLDKFQMEALPTDAIRKVVLLARMLRDKGVGEFHQAAVLLEKDYPNVEFILAGGTHDNPASYSENQLNDWNSEGSVQWIGHQSNVIDVIKKAYIIVLPSYREGLPKVLLEAAAIGRPIITTDVPGCRDAIIENETGLLVPFKNAKALANAMRKLLDSEELCKTLGKNGRLLMEQEFSVDTVVSKHIEIYGNRLSN